MRRLLILVGVIALLVVACSGDDDAGQSVDEQDGGGDIEVESDGGDGGDDGGGDGGEDASGSGSGGVELPDDFPIEVPPGGEVFGVSESDGVYVVIVEYPGDAFDSVVEFFDAELADEGFAVSSPFGNTDISASWSGERGSESLTMTAQGGDQVIVSITYDSGTGG